MEVEQEQKNQETKVRERTSNRNSVNSSDHASVGLRYLR